MRSTDRSTRCSRTRRRSSNKRYREGLLAHAEDARQSRELARIRTDVPVEFHAEALRYRGASRERCFELFTRLGFRTLVMEYAPDAQTVGKDYALVRTLESVRELAAELQSARAIRLRVLPDVPVGDAGRHRRARVLDRPAPRALRAARATRADGRRSVRVDRVTATATRVEWPTPSRH